MKLFHTLFFGWIFFGRVWGGERKEKEGSVMNVDGHLAEFLSITGTTEEDYARGLLESHNGDLEASLASHFAIQDAQGEVNGGRTGEREEEVAPPVVDVEEEEEEDTTPVAPIREQRQFVQNRYV